MKIYIENLLIRILSLFNVFPTSKTDRKQLLELISLLHPIKTNTDLTRFGPMKDGGYLIPDDLKYITSLFSPGVSTESGFENDCANTGMNVYMADASVDKSPIQNDAFSFEKKFIGSISIGHYITLDDWVTSSVASDDSDLLLQIDIEGGEYDALLSTSANLMTRFRIIAIEFHHLDQLWNRRFFNIAKQVFEKLLQTHSCVHIHPNNCDKIINVSGIVIPETMEFTFYRNDRITSKKYQTTYPHHLDVDNTNKKTMVLPTCWYRDAE